MTTLQPLPVGRRGTWTFLHDARSTCHVYLDTEVDATRMREVRTAADGKVGYVSLLVKAAAEVVAEVPEARSVLRAGWLRPKIAEAQQIHAKVLFDRTVAGTRCVLSGVVESVPELSALQVQEAVDAFKDADPEDPQGPFAAQKKMRGLPLPLARLIYRAAMRDPGRRAALQGVFSVTSVGQEQVRVIYPMISGTLGFGIGRIRDVPVAVDGQVRIGPVCTVSLAFDHRVVDGAVASDVLARTKNRLETLEMP
ncbi:2-oxo acid dehydrogenase subunit E2 [Streptacidiphilus fuscans]|uniref:2-oxo acid dehydrogenase subunit E2 n=1 Tax=Streptacidiphilus fuscans TaxID=2789292 RepID=A0A931B7N5_9ACTN|nr:2-oxo acid dehydrogenase subunit E2 [Streptacidiphilus fuscans]MBF9068415.1 2-oxo acid dehydrogenase subunit E2 [Streptacidiphilus fuscans]